MAGLAPPRNRVIPCGVRSDNKAILVLLGLTGAGKTTTLNFLFDERNITKTESYCSATSTIMEYSAKIPCDGVEYELRVIDTPGFGDTRQEAHVRDARFVATFDKLLTTHEDLKSCYPTCVLLVAKFNDDRIDGETSHFIQMLKAVDTLLTKYRLLDKKSPNLIFVLTHTMSEDNKSLREDPRPKVQLIEGLVKTFTQIPTPIQVVMAENKPKNYNLPKLDDFYKLPNGQYYPLNLFRKIQIVAEKCNDCVGESIIREAFKNPSKLKIALHSEMELLPPGNLMVQKMLNILKDARFNIENTFISRQLKEKWDALDEKFKQPYFNSLQIAQMNFHRHGVFGESDLPKTPTAVLQLLEDLPLNPALVTVFESMGIVAPELPKSLGTGCFYNIFTDSIMTNSPFCMDATTVTEIGYRAARGVKAEKICENLAIVSEFGSLAQYNQERLKQLQVKDCFNLEHFTLEKKPGYNIIPTDGSSVTRLTGLRENRLFKIYLKHPRLSVSFESAVRNLPEKFDIADRMAWQAFFNANGTHVVESVYAGGCFEVTATKREEFTGDQTSTEKILEIITDILANVGVHKPINLEAIAPDWDFILTFRGGDPNIIRPTISNIFTANGVEFFKKWTASLAAHPLMLFSEINLENIVVFVEQINFSVSEEMTRAMNLLFAAKIGPKYPPKPNSKLRKNVESPPNPGNNPETWKAWFHRKFRRN